jgi:hypothetical protein
MAFVFGAVALASIYALADIQRRWESAFWGCESIVFGFEERAVRRVLMLGVVYIFDSCGLKRALVLDSCSCTCMI